MITVQEAIDTICTWANAGETKYICIRDVHGVMRAQTDGELLNIHEGAGLVTPDGMPLVWIGRLRGDKHVERVCGSDLVDALCGASVARGLKHYFYGGQPGVAEMMASVLSARYPGLEVSGTLSPPFGVISETDDDKITKDIIAAKPNIIWVGLSTPKQEYWMRDHVSRIPGAVLIGVGAAFDFHTGKVKRAPKWMQRHGLEWLHRLTMDPERLWRRYLVLAPLFVVGILKEQLTGAHLIPARQKT
jgi:N-acetylglucosaminyldiphosphoundecaprenol N-acetyl-beta-D-mannosaminyltransferase